MSGPHPMQRSRRHRGGVAAALLVVALAGGCGRADRTPPRDAAGRTQPPAAATVSVSDDPGGAAGTGAPAPPAAAPVPPVPPVDAGDLAAVDRELSSIDQDLARVDDALAADEGDETP